MNDKDKIDDLYRNSFDDYQMPVSDNLLANIKKDLNIPAKTSKGFSYWKWIYGAFTIAAVTGIAAYFYFNTHDTKKQITENSTNINEQIAVEKNNLNENNIIENKKTNNNTSNNGNNLTQESYSVATETNNTTITTVSENTENPINTSTPTPKPATVTKEPNLPATAKTKIQAANNKQTAVKNKETNFLNEEKKQINNIQQASTNTNKKWKDIEASNDASNSSTEKEDQTNKINNIADKKNNFTDKAENVPQHTTSNTSTNTSTTNQSESKIAANNANSDSTNNNQQNNVEVKNETVTAATSVTAIEENKSDSTKKQTAAKDSTAQALTNTSTTSDKTTDKVSKLNFYMGIYGGPSFANANLTGGNPAFHLLRKDDKKTFNYNAGIDAGAFFKNISVELGLGLDNKGETYSFSGIPQIDTTSITSTFDSINGWTHDTNTVILQKRIDAFDSKSNYQFFRTHIMIGYQFIIKEKIYIHPSAGISYNFLINAKTTGIDFESGNQIQYTKANGIFNASSLAMRAKLDLGIILNENWQLGIQPAYTRFMQSVYKKEEDIILKPYSFDLNLSVRYKF